MTDLAPRSKVNPLSDRSVKYADREGEVEAVLATVRRVLRLIPFEFHRIGRLRRRHGGMTSDVPERLPARLSAATAHGWSGTSGGWPPTSSQMLMWWVGSRRNERLTTTPTAATAIG